jgi:hypothetical protein
LAARMHGVGSFKVIYSEFKRIKPAFVEMLPSEYTERFRYI